MRPSRPRPAGPAAKGEAATGASCSVSSAPVGSLVPGIHIVRQDRMRISHWILLRFRWRPVVPGVPNELRRVGPAVGRPMAPALEVLVCEMPVVPLPDFLRHIRGLLLLPRGRTQACSKSSREHYQAAKAHPATRGCRDFPAVTP